MQEFQYNITTNYQCKISMLYILHAYFVKAKNELAKHWNETVYVVKLNLVTFDLYIFIE